MSQQRNEIDVVAGVAGEPQHVSAAGVTRTANRLLTLENASPFAPSKQSRLVIVAEDERAGRAALGAVRWFKTEAPKTVRDRWAVSALLLGSASDATPAQRLEFPPVKGFFDHPEQPESRYAWRWANYQAPDLLVQLRAAGRCRTRGDDPQGDRGGNLSPGSDESR